MKFCFSSNNERRQQSNLWPLRLQKCLLTSVSHHLYFIHLNTFFWEGVRRFDHNLKGFHGTKKVKTPGLEISKCFKVANPRCAVKYNCLHTLCYLKFLIFRNFKSYFSGIPHTFYSFIYFTFYVYFHLQTLRSDSWNTVAKPLFFIVVFGAW